MPPRTASPAVARTTTATSTSMSAAPRSSESWRMSDADLVEDAVHGGDERHRHEAHDEAHRDDHGGLEEGGEPLDLVAELALVVGRGGLQLGVQRAGLLADADHLRRGGREQAGASEGLGQPLTAEH